MIGLVLVTHENLANAFVSTLEHLLGPQKNIKTICIQSDDKAEHHRSEILKAIEEVDTGKGVALLTDLFGGVPSDLAISMLSLKPVEVVAGLNLPLLMKLVQVRNTLPLHEAVHAAQEAGRKYINVASSLLNTYPASPNSFPNEVQDPAG